MAGAVARVCERDHGRGWSGGRGLRFSTLDRGGDAVEEMRAGHLHWIGKGKEGLLGVESEALCLTLLVL